MRLLSLGIISIDVVGEKHDYLKCVYLFFGQFMKISVFKMCIWEIKRGRSSSTLLKLRGRFQLTSNISIFSMLYKRLFSVLKNGLLFSHSLQVLMYTWLSNLELKTKYLINNSIANFKSCLNAKSALIQHIFFKIYL